MRPSVPILQTNMQIDHMTCLSLQNHLVVVVLGLEHRPRMNSGS